MTQPGATPTDTVVRCRDCGREERVEFSRALRFGWPKCYCRNALYGYTMHLEATRADIEQATAHVIQEQVR